MCGAGCGGERGGDFGGGAGGSRWVVGWLIGSGEILGMSVLIGLNITFIQN